MIKHLATGIVLAALFAGTAVGQSTPPSEGQPAQPPAAQPAPTAPVAPAVQPPPAPAAQAQTPASSEECIKLATDLANHAEAKNLADEKLDRIEELLTKMETHCDARQFAEAMLVAKDIRTVIDGQ